MGPKDDDSRYDEVKRCLGEADRAFARAGAVDDDVERLRLIEEAEGWLIRAERRLAQITGRATAERQPQAAPRETRSFRAERSPSNEVVWPRLPRA